METNSFSDAEKIMQEIEKLIAYKYTFIKRKSYIQGIIDERIDTLKYQLEYLGIDGERYLKSIEAKWARKKFA